MILNEKCNDHSFLSRLVDSKFLFGALLCAIISSLKPAQSQVCITIVFKLNCCFVVETNLLCYGNILPYQGYQFEIGKNNCFKGFN